ncbi:MAG TPA: hypothetical protein VK137_15970, partial [Planctomycetaceae bacterium]|nr:hypothetical protein [Planctomycetaceae bacterium]
MPQVAGTYTFKVDGTATTGEVGTTARGIVLLTTDTSQPTVAITAPSSGATLSNVYQNGSAIVPITGSVTDTNLHNWVLDYGLGSNPTSWTSLAGGTGAVQNAQFTSWDTLPVANGSYTLRLRSCSTYGYDVTLTEPVVVGNFQFTQPAAYQVNATNGTLTYTSIIPFTLTETLVFKNEAGVTKRTLVNTSRAGATYNDVWDGRGDTGTYLPHAAYFY